MTLYSLLAGSPNPPFNGSYMYDGGLTVHLQWNRPSYTGGAPVENYTVSANGQSETVSDSNEVVSYTSSGLIYGEVLVITINRCGLESQSALITIPASGLWLMEMHMYFKHNDNCRGVQCYSAPLFLRKRLLK